MNETLIDGSELKNSAVEAWKADGGKVVGTICCHVPEEIIHAAGMLPYRLRATGVTETSEGDAWMSPFTCSYARGCLQYLIDGTFAFIDGLVASDGCLMAGRIYDNWKYVDINKDKEEIFFQQIAAPRTFTPKSIEYYREHLETLRQGLEVWGGVKITEEKLRASVQLYNETRRLIRELYELSKSDTPVLSGEERLRIILAASSTPKEKFNEQLRAFLATAGSRKPVAAGRARIMLVGSALDDPEYIRIIEEKGGLVVTDALCFGTRYLWEPVEPEEGDALTAIAKSYLGRPVCPRMVDLHNEFRDFMIGMAKDYRVDGIIYSRVKYCEVWGGEGLYFNEQLQEENIPQILLEREEIMTSSGQLAVRAEAFIEMIEKQVGGKIHE
ncbi:MAG: 2-hydroxyacyl-CoA dehydratase family protein [Gracilibacteraceae bacterium]|jgi:bzd-type benzoyl-CoA reductase N subunit|nr:2-hydroxyacyl-CoA dehydratase family protein [Gracilibacteraceae bacterium]